MTGHDQASAIPDAQVREALARLRRLLPLAQRLQQQPAAVRSVHRAILDGFVRSGRPPSATGGVGDHEQWEAACDALAAADLIVRGPQDEVQGAYPFTRVSTAHRLRMDEVQVHAMCAVDALAVAPLLGRTVHVQSRCAVSDQSIAIMQHGKTLASVQPPDARVGIEWGDTDGCAARSLCRNMVFLVDVELAHGWQADAAPVRTVLRLDQATELGRRFFAPLLMRPL